MIPILLLFFNRIDTLKSVMHSIELYKPSRIYLASDGPRAYVLGEAEKVREVREYVISKIVWNCEIKTLFREENLGCKRAVHEAVQWFFSSEDSGIVLEDDIVPSLNFYKFCDRALEQFKDNKKIGSITGRNELGQWGSDAVFAASRFQCWGWASWSDRILGMDVEYGYDKGLDYSILYQGSMWEERCYIDSVLGLLQTNQVDSWAYAYDLNFKKAKQLQVYPKLNMVKNIGFGDSGTHSASRLSDEVPFFDDYNPLGNCFDNFRAEADSMYVKKKLRSEYGGVFNLYLMRYVRYLRWLRKAKKALNNYF